MHCVMHYVMHYTPQVRLELEKKLAASSQKFAEAAKLSAELKVLAAKHDGDVATRQQVRSQLAVSLQ